MKVIVDTNVLLRAVIEDDIYQTRQARALLVRAELIVIPLAALCEFAWVASRSYRLDKAQVAVSINFLLESEAVICDRAAVEAGLDMIEAGGDFADGVIAFEGRRLGGGTFATFDKKAATILKATGEDCLLLSIE
ncbi:type II toxin-antitoxin system VapC family toxin [Rhizobium binxianense]